MLLHLGGSVYPDDADLEGLEAVPEERHELLALSRGRRRAEARDRGSCGDVG